MAKNGQILFLNGQNFAISELSRHIQYDWLPGKSQNSKKFHTKNSKNSQFWPKTGKIFVINGQNFAKSEFSRHIEYNFLKKDQQNNFHIKIRKILYRPKTLKLALNGQNFLIEDHTTKKLFGGHLSHMETQLHAKNQKKILNDQGCRTGANERTDGRTKAKP